MKKTACAITLILVVTLIGIGTWVGLSVNSLRRNPKDDHTPTTLTKDMVVKKELAKESSRNAISGKELPMGDSSVENGQGPKKGVESPEIKPALREILLIEREDLNKNEEEIVKLLKAIQNYQKEKARCEEEEEEQLKQVKQREDAKLLEQKQLKETEAERLKKEQIAKDLEEQKLKEKKLKDEEQKQLKEKEAAKHLEVQKAEKEAERLKKEQIAKDLEEQKLKEKKIKDEEEQTQKIQREKELQEKQTHEDQDDTVHDDSKDGPPSIPVVDTIEPTSSEHTKVSKAKKKAKKPKVISDGDRLMKQITEKRAKEKETLKEMAGKSGI